jgi:hypothetical protein
MHNAWFDCRVEGKGQVDFHRRLAATNFFSAAPKNGRRPARLSS